MQLEFSKYKQMKKLVLFLFFIPLATFGQALFLPISIKDVETKQGIAGLTVNSQWADDAQTDSNGKAELSFALNGDEKYVVININSTGYSTVNQNQFFVPTKWNSTFPWEIKMLKKQTYTTNFTKYFKTIQKLIIAHQTEFLHPAQILSTSYLIAKDLMAYQYDISIKFALPTFNQIIKGNLQQANEILDSTKIAFYADNLESQKENLDSFRPNYQYLLENIQEQNSQLQKIKDLKFILDLFSYKTKTYNAQNKAQSYAQKLYELSTLRKKELTFQLADKDTTQNNPLYRIKFKLLEALSHFNGQNFTEASDEFSQIYEQLNTLTQINLIDLKDFTQSLEALSKSQSENSNQAQADLQSAISSLSANSTTQWLKILLQSKLQNTSDLNPINTSNIHPDLQSILAMQSFRNINFENFKKFDFKANFNYYNQLSAIINNAKLPKVQEQKISELFYAYYLQNSLLNNSPDSLDHFISSHQQIGNSKQHNFFTDLSKGVYTPGDFSNSPYSIALSHTFKPKTREAAFASALTNINNLKDLNYKYWLKSILLLRYTDFLLQNKSEKLNSIDYLDYIKYQDESPFDYSYLYLKPYYFKFNLLKAQNLIKQNRNLEALNILQPLSENIENTSSNNPQYFSSLLLETNYETANLLIRQEQYSQAAEYLNFTPEQIHKDENSELSFGLYRLKGITANYFSQREKALNNFKLALSFARGVQTDISNELFDIYSAMAKIYENKNDARKAIDFLIKAQKNSKSDTLQQKALISQAKIHITQKQYSLAIQNLDDAENLSPADISENRIEITNFKAKIYIKQRLYDKASRLLEALISIKTSTMSPNLKDKFSDSYYLLGGIYLSKDDYKNAMQNFETSSKLRKQVYESRPGKYEVKIAEALLKYAIAAYNSLQKDMNQDVHRTGLEKVGLAISILKKYNTLSQKNQSNLQYALQLRNDFEDIVR